MINHDESHDFHPYKLVVKKIQMGWNHQPFLFFFLREIVGHPRDSHDRNLPMMSISPEKVSRNAFLAAKRLGNK